jgi:hypothetical protein
MDLNPCLTGLKATPDIPLQMINFLPAIQDRLVHHITDGDNPHQPFLFHHR